MPVGKSGRIVIEIDPELKHELYAALESDKVTLKQWFLERVEEYLRDRGQLSLRLVVEYSDENSNEKNYLGGRKRQVDIIRPYHN